MPDTNWSEFTTAEPGEDPAPPNWEEFSTEPPVSPSTFRPDPYQSYVMSRFNQPGEAMTPFGPINPSEVLTGPNLVSLGQAEVDAAKAGLEKAQAVAEKYGHPVASLLHGLTIPVRLATGNTMLQTMAEAPKEGESVIPEIMPAPDDRGVIPSLRRFAGGMTTGGSLITLPLLPESKAVEGAFAGQAALQIPEAIRQAGDAPDAAGVRGAITDATINAAMLFLLGKRLAGKERTPNASEISEATKVHGDVQPQPGEGQGQMPAQEGGARVQPQAAPVAEEAPVSLTPQEQAYLDAERQGLDVPVETTEFLPEDQPFAGKIATIDRKNRKILINPGEFSGWLKGIPEEQRQAAVKSLLGEERIHLAVTDLLADAYWSGLTAAEKAIVRRRYTGTFSGEALQSGERVSVSDTDFGHEALRFRMQQLARMTPREIAEAVGREKWTLKGLTALETAIRTIREAIGTRASGVQLAILDRVQRNLDAAKAVATGNAPFALNKNPESPEDFAEKSGWTMKNGQLSAGVQMPDEATLSPEDKALYQRLRENLPKTIEFTDRRPDSPTRGLTFYVPENASPEQIMKAYRAKLAQATLPDEPPPHIFERAPAALRKSAKEREIIENRLAQVRGYLASFNREESPKVYDDLKAQEAELVSELGAGGEEQSFPAALRKRGKATSKQQPELVLPPLEAGERREGPPSAKFTGSDELPLETGGTPEGRPGATEYSPIASPKALEKAVDEHLNANTRPSFNKFAEEVNKYGTVQKGQLRELWTDAVWKNLSRMPGDQLSRIRDSLGLGTQVGTKGIADAAPELPPVQKQMAGMTGERAIGRRPAGVRAIEAAIKSPEQKYRNMVIARIGERLIGEADTGAKAWRRSEITPEDLGHWRETTSGSFFDIRGEDLAKPGELGRMITEGAAVERSTVRRKVRGGQLIETQSKAPPESVTKRVTAMVDRTTGKVYLVSTYRKPRSGAMLLDPALINKQRMHRPLADLLERYRPIASMLLDEPVQNFRQTFDSVRQFEEEFGKPARREANRQASYEAKFGDVEEPEEKKGQLETQFSQPLNEDEATSLFDQLHEEVGKIDSVEDIQHALAALKDRVQSDKLRPMDFNALGAYVKAYDAIRSAHPEISPEAAMDRMAQEIYDKVKNSESVEAFLKDFVDSYSTGPRQSVRRAPDREGQPAKPNQKKSVTRELTHMRDLPPTVDPNVQLPKGPAPEPKLPAPEPPAKLTPEELDHVQKLAADRYPYTPTAEPSIWQAEDDLPEAPESSPGALRKRAIRTQSTWSRTIDAIFASAARRSVRKDLPRTLAGFNNEGQLYATEAGSNIRLASNEDRAYTPKTFKERLLDPLQTVIDGFNYVRGKQPMTEPEWRRAAVHVFIAAGKRNKFGTWYADKGMLNHFRSLLRVGEQRAQNKIQFGNVFDRRLGRAMLDFIKNELEPSLDYAENHWRDREMWRTVKAFRQEMKAEIDFENNNGGTVTERDNYFPGRYEGDFWHDNGINFGAARRLMGTLYRRKKKFQNYFEAIAAGPYIAASLDAADLAQHRITQGRRNIGGRLWTQSLKTMMDPDSKQPIAMEPIKLIKRVPFTDPATGVTVSVPMEAGWKSPRPDYDLYNPGGINSKPIAVRRSYKHLVEILMEPDKSDRIPFAPEFHAATSMMKHGAILVLDTFHPGRVLQYGASMLGIGEKLGSKGGYSALNYRLADLDRAVNQGEISKAAADWAKEKVNVWTSGRTRTATGWTTTPMSMRMTRKALADELVKNGLNATKISDALYKDVVQRMPIIGDISHRLLDPYNSWLFQKFMPGLMLETAVRSFEKYNAKHPNIPLEKLSKDVIRDVNTRYGNLGQQGIFRSKTFQSLSQILFLAPMWQEGILRSELVALSRLAGVSWLTGRRGLPYMGTLGSGVMKGLLFYVGLTQAINLITRGKPTWKNEEKEHKLDAWLPIGEHGVWISPMAVFAELTHDIVRLSQAKNTTGDAVMQMVSNRMGPFGKAAYTWIRNESPTGEKYTSTGRRLAGAAGAAAPTPIALGVLSRYAANKLAPSTVSPNQPGALPRQLLASMSGIKVEAGKSILQEEEKRARDWMQKNNLQPESVSISPTDQASYAKLRNAIRNSDQASAKSLYKELLQHHSGSDVMTAMKKWSTMPLTGSKAHEQLYLMDLSDRELERYQQAVEAKLAEYEKIVDWLLAHGE